MTPFSLEITIISMYMRPSITGSNTRESSNLSASNTAVHFMHSIYMVMMMMMRRMYQAVSEVKSLVNHPVRMDGQTCFRTYFGLVFLN